MAKRLNPQRRKEMWERKQAILRNQTTLTEEGVMRLNAGQLERSRGLQGSSKGLARGLLHQEANMPVYAKPKRRKATKKALHVNPKDVSRITTPEMAKVRLGAQWPKPRQTAKKVWSNS